MSFFWLSVYKELTRQSGVLDLFESGNSGFKIEEDLILSGVHLNIPPFMHGKSKLSTAEVVEQEA